jgi:hypothetical protein
VLAALAVPLAATALASGTGTSAGDQQYVDPLTTTTATTTTHGSTSPAPATTPAATSTAVSSTSTTPTASAASSSAQPTSGTLPYTGLNVGACMAVGIGLLGAGLVLRRIVARV